MNNKILKDRWEEVDKLLSEFYSKNKKINARAYNKIQAVLDGIDFSYEEMDNYASMKNISRLRVKVDEAKDKYGLNGYLGYQLSNYSRRKKLKNKDLLLALIMLEYYNLYQEQKKEEMILFDEVVNMTYISVSTETINVLKPKDQKKKIRLLTVPEAFLLQLIGMSGFNGFKWYDYREGVVGYNTRKFYELLLILMQQGKKLDVDDKEFKKLLGKQEKAYLNQTDETPIGDYKDVFSGAIDNQISTLVNRITLQAIKDQGCTKVQFVAVMDAKTTKMCRSLDGQLFDIYEENTYKRYSDEDNKIITYTTKGLETGANLPPINNHFHYCRSTIYTYK